VLFIQLLAIGLYACGTIMTNRFKDVKMYKKEKLERGTVKMATAEIGKFGKLTALSW
jgi:hypothetical protein